MISELWIIGAVGYYSSLIVWIIAQRTHHIHGKYSHSWAIGILLMIFGVMQIVGSLSNTLIAITGLVSMVMPIIVTTIDIDDHMREGRGPLEHKPDCWMESNSSRKHHELPPGQISPVKETDENWSSR
jgi:hypothetical protein